MVPFLLAPSTASQSAASGTCLLSLGHVSVMELLHSLSDLVRAGLDILHGGLGSRGT